MISKIELNESIKNTQNKVNELLKALDLYDTLNEEIEFTEELPNSQTTNSYSRRTFYNLPSKRYYNEKIEEAKSEKQIGLTH